MKTKKKWEHLLSSISDQIWFISITNILLTRPLDTDNIHIDVNSNIKHPRCTLYEMII